MRLVDELFEMYQDRLSGDEEDLDMITFAVLENYGRKELVGLVNDMNDHELQYFISLYLNESLKAKFARSTGKINDQQTSKYLH